MDTVMLKGKETGLMALGIVVGILVASELVRMILWAEIRRKKCSVAAGRRRGPGEEESGLIKYSLFGSVKRPIPVIIRKNGKYARRNPRKKGNASRCLIC